MFTRRRRVFVRCKVESDMFARPGGAQAKKVAVGARRAVAKRRLKYATAAILLAPEGIGAVASFIRKRGGVLAGRFFFVCN